jgi:hypothetical protein
MSSKKIRLKYKKERAILSDVLPYETPLTFTNWHFYNFLLRYKIRYNADKIEWLADDAVVDCIIRLLFGIQESSEKNIKAEIPSNKSDSKQLPVDQIAIPFRYRISHKQNEYRELAIPHPKNQLRIIEFYDRYKELIIYYCSISSFSIRHPKKIAKYIFYKDSTHYKNLSDDSSSKVEEVNKEYENLRSFFVYKDYSNVYKFYESNKFHDCEKKYNNLLKLDISKCFDSIYTHSLAWALLSKESVKASLIESKETFAGSFDKLMQEINHNETHGIIIGPEFSRIFAELILQSIDSTVKQELLQHNLKHKVDYKIFRYVDDYFIFFNKDSTVNKITQVLQVELKKHKLYLNTAKSIRYEKPIITEISIAKQRVASLIDKQLIYQLEDIEPKDKEGQSLKKGFIYIKSKTLITQFKIIIKESRVEYKDMLNYSLSIVDKRCNKIIKNYYKTLHSKDDKREERLIKAILGILEFIFFIYSASPRVNATIKLCRILQTFVSCLKEKDTNINKDFKHLVFKCIYDNICFVLKKNKSSEYFQVETLYLLLALSELGRDYRLEESVLVEYFNIKKNDLDYVIDSELNYFSITVVLLYIKDKKSFNKLRVFIENEIIKKFKSKKGTLYIDAELTMLLLDTISCPYVSKNTKIELLNLYRINQDLHNDILNLKHNWFTTWNDFNFGKALDMKQSKEVY